MYQTPMKPSFLRHLIKTAFFLGIFFLGSCVSSKTDYQREYGRVWKEMIQSEAWKNSLESTAETTSSDQEVMYAGTSDIPIKDTQLVTSEDMSYKFKEKYNSLVARAYFKIISEAEKSDVRLMAQFKSLEEQQQYNDKNDKIAQKNFALVRKRYDAHKEMLKGLKSWNIFSDKRSGDLDFFKEENIDETYKMYQQNKTDDAMIGFLIYKLADLYHFEE